MAMQCFRNCIEFTVVYETSKVVEIKHKKIGIVYRLTQIFILSYVIGYVILYEKGYQTKDVAISTVNTKLKGTAYVDFKNFSSLFNGIQVYDSTDYVIPPRENNGFFVMTNMVITPNQTQGKCPGDERYFGNRCSSDADCQPRLSLEHSRNSFTTGTCVASSRRSNVKVCEIYGWCPVERDNLPMPGLGFKDKIPLLDKAKDFTVLIKNHIHFPKFNVLRRNIFGFKDRTELKYCRYDKKKNKFCPIFKLDDILKYCGDKFTDVAFKGAVYGIEIKWDCNLDFSLDNCVPEYEFSRMDDPNAPISPGYNFRTSTYFVSDKRRYRTLTKVFGIKFMVFVSAKAGKFDPVPFFLNLGAGLALLGLAQVGCDFLMVYCLKKRHLYRQFKTDFFQDSDESCDEEKQAMVNKSLEE